MSSAAPSGGSGGGYDPKAVEPDILAYWETGGWFRARVNPDRKPYTIVIPPPNVTGALHMGHALNNTLQDILIRTHRMRGYEACWLPGTDHAGIATQAVVEKRLREEQHWKRDSANPEHRKFLVDKIWEWKEEYNARILGQLRRMGCSCDWPRTRFTLDEQCAAAVYETFFRMFRDGLIYRGTRLVNWDTQLQTAVADDEVYHETVRGHLWHIRYPLAEGARGQGAKGSRVQGAEGAPGASSLDPSAPRPLGPFLTVATTRPETMLADTAVAVHPDDERFKHLIGQRVVLPLTGRTIPVVADGMLVKREFGTGCVKVTPGHDPNDYACWQRKQGQPDQIEIRNMMTPDGRVSPDNAGEGGKYAGLKLEEARKRVVADLEAAGLLEKVEPYETDVGHSDRSKTPIQPFLSEQWFVRMDRLAELAMEAVRDGRVQFFPERFARSYLDWLGEKRDWCISRQLWWGHRIPVWHDRITVNSREDATDEIMFRGLDHAILGEHRGVVARLVNARTGQVIDPEFSVGPRVPAPDAPGWHKQQVSFGRFDTGELRGDFDVYLCIVDADQARYYEDHGFAQDPDVLDTWFSSALWPHSTFGWPAADGNLNSQISDLKSEISNLKSEPSDLSYFYPTSVLCTARDIISLWVARMVMTGLYNMGRVPFQHVYINPTIQDGQGRRMSKSLGNGVDPMDLIDMYGADAMRFTLASLAGETQDCRLPVRPAQLPDGRTVNSSERFELGRNLCNKLWQAATGFVLPTVRDVRIERQSNGLFTKRTPEQMPHFERWIRVKLLDAIRAVDDHLSRYEFSAAADTLRSFFWNEFCDWYIEEVKGHLRDSGVSADEANDVKVALLQVFDIQLALFHPIIPFVTERVWQTIGEAIPRHHELIWPDDPGQRCPAAAPALAVTPWPRHPDAAEGGASAADAAWLRAVAAQRSAADEVDVVLGVVRALREVRASVNSLRSAGKQSALKTLPRGLVRAEGGRAKLLTGYEAVIRRLGQCDALEIGPAVAKPPESASKVLTGVEVYVPLAGLADLEIERKRLHKEREELAAHVGRIEAKLGNEGFVAKAPAAVIEAERARLSEYREKLATVVRHLADVGG